MPKERLCGYMIIRQIDIKTKALLGIEMGNT